MRMIEIAICDDELLIAGQIELMIQDIMVACDLKSNIEVFSGGMELEKAMEEGIRFDIIYMDIEMKEKNGLEVSEALRSIDKNAILIFVSSHESYMRLAFNYRPFQFITKPVDYNLFKKCFLEAYEEIQRNNFYFHYNYDKAYHKVLVQDIMYFESKKRKVYIVCQNGKKLFYEKLNDIEMELDKTNARFIRIHQSYLVNFSYISVIFYDSIELTDGTSLSISKDRRTKIREDHYNMIMSKGNDNE